MNLKFKSYAGAMNIVDNNNLQERVFHFLFISFGALGLFYILILGNMIFSITERRNLEAEARVLSNEVLGLELTYLDIYNKVDLSMAQSLGFKEARATYATRKSALSIKLVNNDL